MFAINIPQRDMKWIGFISVVCIGLNVAGWWLLGDVALFISLGCLMALMCISVFMVHQRSRKIFRKMKAMRSSILSTQEKYYKRLEALFSLFSTLQPTVPLPDTGRIHAMAASPDFLKKITEIIHQQHPELIVEASCGLSTLISAYCLQKLGKGKVIALEHDAQYAASTQEMIALHGLQDIATVIHAPLKETVINGESWQWYDISELQLEQPIDLLFVDGPPAKLQPLSRYPALPLLFEHLHEHSVILLDDGKRPDEQEIVKRWSQEFQGLSAEFLPLERGAYLIRRQRVQ